MFDTLCSTKRLNVRIMFRREILRYVLRVSVPPFEFVSKCSVYIFTKLRLFLSCSFFLPQRRWWWQWWDYKVGVCPLSAVSHGPLPPLSFYSLLLGDVALSPNATQAKTPLSSFAKACYLGITAIPLLLFYPHLLSPYFSAWAGHRFYFLEHISLRVIHDSVAFET